MATTRRMGTRIGALAVSTTFMLATMVGTITPATAAIPPPDDVRAVHAATKAVGFRWTPTGDDTYRIRFATNLEMTSGADTWNVRGNYYELTNTDASPSAYAPRLTPGKTYFFQVKAIADTQDRESLSSYSKPIAVTLPKSGYSELKPMDLKATSGGANSMYVSWRTRGPGVSYVLRYTTVRSDDILQWKSVKLETSGGAVEGLKPGTRYYFRARVIDKAGKGLSNYSSSGFSATTTSTTPSPGLSVVTYNVRKIYSTADWQSRRGAVAANILAQHPDVLGLQEATPIRWATNDTKQYDDLLNLLGSKYSFVTRTGSSGSKLVYNTDRLTVVNTGVKELLNFGSTKRYGVWAILKDKASGKTFFVINTHLEPGSQTSTYNDVRIKQANELLAVIDDNAGSRPVVILGDMNSSRYASPSNGQYDVFTGAGYVDPVDNAKPSWKSGANAASEHILDGQYNSSNGLEERARLTPYPIGTNIDYAYVSPEVRVATWRTVVNLDTDSNFVGTIPSDHNLIHLWLHLP